MTRTPHEVMKAFPISHHHEVRETFADTMGLTVFDGTTLRLNFTIARMDAPTPPAPPAGERHIVCRLVLSANGAIDLINQMNQIAGQLVQAGLIKMEQGQAKPGKKLN